MNWVPIPSTFAVNVELLSNLIDRIGSTDFDIALLHFVNEVSPIRIAEVCGYVHANAQAPTIAGWCGVRADTTDRIETYINSFHIKDAVLLDLPQPVQTQKGYVTSLSAEEVTDREYRHLFFDTPEFATEIAMVRFEKHGWNLSKFYLQEKFITHDTLIELGCLAALIYPIGKRHALNNDDTLASDSRPKARDRLLRLLELRFPQLSGREREVCALTILGNSTKLIASMLGVSPNTVITYRQRAYERLGVSNASSLVSEII